MKVEYLVHVHLSRREGFCGKVSVQFLQLHGHYWTMEKISKQKRFQSCTESLMVAVDHEGKVLTLLDTDQELFTPSQFTRLTGSEAERSKTPDDYPAVFQITSV